MAYATILVPGSRRMGCTWKSGSGWLQDNNGKINESRPQGWFVGWAEKTDGKLFSPDWNRKGKSDIPGGSKAREGYSRGITRVDG